MHVVALARMLSDASSNREFTVSLLMLLPKQCALEKMVWEPLPIMMELEERDWALLPKAIALALLDLADLPIAMEPVLAA